MLDSEFLIPHKLLKAVKVLALFTFPHSALLRVSHRNASSLNGSLWISTLHCLTDFIVLKNSFRVPDNEY